MGSVDVLDAPRVIKTLIARRRIGSTLLPLAGLYQSVLHRYDFDDRPDVGTDW